MKHLSGLTCLFILLYLTVSCENPEKLSATWNDGPNIVLIVSDDHGSRDLGAYGNTAIQTPNLDKLAKEGVLFNNAYCTTASCSASRSVILTGLYNHANGHFGHQHHFHHFSAYDHVQSLPVLLEELGGYRTARIGKYHLAPETVFRFQEVLKGNPRNAVEMADNSKQFINDSSQPFFLYFCTSDPHRSGDEYPVELGANRFGNIDDGYPGVSERKFDPEEVEIPPYLPESQQTREELAEYYQSVYRMDQGIGKLFEHIRESGKWDNTVILYISDNGIAFAGAKTTLYQPGINLPLIVKNANGENAGSVTDDFVNWADLTPTILDIAGVMGPSLERLDSIYNITGRQWDNTANKVFHGSSFNDVLSGTSRSDKVTYASHTFHEITMYYPMRSIVTDQYKLIWNVAYQLPYPHATDLWASSTWQAALLSDSKMYGPRTVEDYTFRREFELYDVSKDPYESNNLAYDDNYQEVLLGMIKKLQDFQHQTNDPWVAKWEHE